MPDALPFDEAYFHLLVCPLSRRPLAFSGGRLVSTDPETRRAYPIIDGIPELVIDAGEPLSAADWQAAMDAAVLIGQGVAKADELARATDGRGQESGSA